MKAILIVTLIVVVVALLLFSMLRRRNEKKSSDYANIITEHISSNCNEYERAFRRQLSRLSEADVALEENIESRLRARLIGGFYIIRGYLDLAHDRKKAFISLSYAEQLIMSTGIAAEPLNIRGSNDEQRLRTVTAEVINDLTKHVQHASSPDDLIEGLAACWSECFTCIGYRFGIHTDIDQLVSGWSRQSATAGMEILSEIQSQ